MNFILNTLWLLCGGLVIAVAYLLAGLVMFITIIGIPFGMQSFKLASMAIRPFGLKTDNTSRPSGCLLIFMNILWLLCGGLSIAILHLALGVILCLTIIGIPFGLQHFKLMELAIFPFGSNITDA